MILIKDNHIDFAGGTRRGRRTRRAGRQPNLEIEVEARTLEDVQTALDLEVERILLDNMTVEMMAAAVRLSAGRARLEASGNVNLENVRRIAETGVDFISIGALTHSAKNFDLSFEYVAPGAAAEEAAVNPEVQDMYEEHEGPAGQRGAGRGAGLQGRDRGRDPRAEAAAQRGHPGTQLHGAGAVPLGPGFQGRLARPEPQGRPDRQGRDRLLRRALHGRDGQDPESDQDRAAAGREGRLLAGRQHHRRGCAHSESSSSPACRW